VGALMRSSHVHFMVDPGVRVFSHSLGHDLPFVPQLKILTCMLPEL